MDIKEYIASGIIDSYVLGSVSDQERQEVQCLSKIYPEIKEELRKAEKALEDYAQSIAVNPPKEIKDAILNRIKEIKQEPAESVVKTESKSSDEEKVAKVIQIPTMYKWSVAASILIIIGLGFAFVNSYSNETQLKEELASMQEESSETEKALETQLNQLQASLFAAQEREAFINAPNTRKLLLEGTPLKPEANATVYWDESTGSAILASNGLPSPTTGKQFQLWAISDGQPVDLGVIDKDSVYTPKIPVNLKSVQAFAITLEKEGGSPTPNLEELYVIGNV